MREYTFNITKRQWVDTNKNRGVPYIRFGENVVLHLYLEYLDEYGSVQPFNEWYNKGYQFRFVVDNDYNLFFPYTLAQDLSGAITQIKINEVPDIPRTGTVILINKFNQFETVTVNGFKGNIFYVDKTLSNSYEKGDEVRFIDPFLINVENSNIDQSNLNEGLIKITIDAETRQFLSTINAVSQMSGMWELQVYNGLNFIDAVSGDILLIGTLYYENLYI